MCHPQFLGEFNIGNRLRKYNKGKIKTTFASQPSENTKMRLYVDALVCHRQVINNNMWAYDLKFSLPNEKTHRNFSLFLLFL